MSAIFRAVNLCQRVVRFVVPKRLLPVKGYDKCHEIMRVSATMTDFKGRDSPRPMSPAGPPVTSTGNGDVQKAPPSPSTTILGVPNGVNGGPHHHHHAGTTTAKNKLPPVKNTDEGIAKPADGDDDGLSEIPESKKLALESDGSLHQELVVTIAEE